MLDSLESLPAHLCWGENVKYAEPAEPHKKQNPGEERHSREWRLSVRLVAICLAPLRKQGLSRKVGASGTREAYGRDVMATLGNQPGQGVKGEIPLLW